MKNNFDLRKFLVENKLTENSRQLAEGYKLNPNGSVEDQEGTSIYQIPDTTTVEELKEHIGKGIALGTVISVQSPPMVESFMPVSFTDSKDPNKKLGKVGSIVELSTPAPLTLKNFGPQKGYLDRNSFYNV